MQRVLAVVTFAVVTSGLAGAQDHRGTRRGFASPVSTPSSHVTGLRAEASNRPVTGEMMISGLGIGIVGIAAGAYLGARMEECADDSFCGVTGGVIGGTIGGTITIPLGVHTSSSRSPYLQKLLASAAVGAVSWLLVKPTFGVSILAMPLFQAWVNASQEQTAYRRRLAPTR